MQMQKCDSFVMDVAVEIVYPWGIAIVSSISHTVGRASGCPM